MQLFMYLLTQYLHGQWEGVVKQKADRRGQVKGGGLENWQKRADILYGSNSISYLHEL